MVKTQPKMTKLVVSAIRNLRDVQGSTAKDILNYVMRECATEPSMERKLQTALKRGLEFGILKRSHGHYTLNTADPEMLQDSSPMERSRSRRRGRRRRGRGGKRKSSMGKRGRGRKRRRRRGGRGKSRGRSRRGRRGKSRRGRRAGGGGRRRRRRRRRRGGRRMRSRSNVDDIDMLAKEPLELSRPGGGDAVSGGGEFTRARSRSRSRNSRSRSRTPTHSQSSLSSDREGVETNRPTE